MPARKYCLQCFATHNVSPVRLFVYVTPIWNTGGHTPVDGPPATTHLKTKEMLKMRSQLPRRETTMATLVRSESIGPRAFLHKQRVQRFDNPACDCGGGRQTAKHTIMFCAKWNRARRQDLKTTEKWCLRRGESGQSLSG